MALFVVLVVLVVPFAFVCRPLSTSADPRAQANGIQPYVSRFRALGGYDYDGKETQAGAALWKQHADHG